MSTSLQPLPVPRPWRRWAARGVAWSAAVLLASCVAFRLAHAQPVEVSKPAYPTALLQRADDLLARGDVSAARKLWESAANAGVPSAALALARTYDPVVIGQQHWSVASDPAAASSWYRRAAELGDPSAAAAIARLQSK